VIFCEIIVHLLVVVHNDNKMPEDDTIMSKHVAV